MDKILIAEDEPHVARLLSRALEKQGYTIDAVHNGIQALEKINASHPDMLITDINMPKMDGEELCKQLTTSIPDRKFPIVVLSSRTEVEHREWSASMSNTTFIEKPVSMRRLIKFIEDASQK